LYATFKAKIKAKHSTLNDREIDWKSRNKVVYNCITVVENHLLYQLYEFCERHRMVGRSTELEFDGLCGLENTFRSDADKDAFVREANNYLYETTGVHMELAFKKLTHSIDEIVEAAGPCPPREELPSESAGGGGAPRDIPPDELSEVALKQTLAKMKLYKTKAAYRREYLRLAKAWHPDRNRGTEREPIATRCL